MTKKEEWGNIELPGLSDEELYAKNWNRIAAAQERLKDPNWQKNYAESRKKLETAEWAESHRQSTLKKLEDPEHRKKIKEITKQKVLRESWRDGQAKAAESRKNNPNWYKNLMASHQTEEYKAKFKEKSIRQQKPVMTPDGPFDSIRAVADHYRVDRAMVGYWRTRKPTEFYYISVEEYKNLCKSKTDK